MILRRRLSAGIHAVNCGACPELAKAFRAFCRDGQPTNAYSGCMVLAQQMEPGGFLAVARYPHAMPARFGRGPTRHDVLQILVVR
jgi:hypothetical protein